MNEKDRLKVVNIINKDINELNKINTLRKAIKEYESIDLIKDYNKKIAELKCLENKLVLFRDSNDVKEMNFEWAIEDEEYLDPCTHPAWLYEETRLNGDTQINVYSCLECGKKRYITNVLDFEVWNNVIHTDNPKRNEDYRRLYYRYLYDNKEMDAVEKVINYSKKLTKKTSKK